ncbi:two component, sigma54 specific, transcriptional regulator, Fis family [Bryocella elongata]|uniref:Two component, sigma54 specific, transcriptional regulator, Fis family n=1 Tax=Bryocella elongata TaxID=863522 RepID=A0A1H5S9Q6_9BACT|nr:sigma-54 dependent transcriptional regulator [Bryocella elongata]SEF47292.1 two component, sigma54 specific, transcriptional regulator, Fis family [Bryocella elongata]
MTHILIVDDEADIRDSLEAILREEDYTITTAGTAGEALELTRDVDFDAVLLDIWLPDMDGLDVLARIRGDATEPRANAPEVIMISGHGTIEAAVRATKLGAFDFLEKPLSLDRTLLVLRNAVQQRRLRDENLEFSRQLTVQSRITGESVPIKALRQQIGLMAPTNGRVLIFGESGTGKELIARSIHAESLRRDRVFVELNCAAIPEDFIEAELFGYRHGAGPTYGGRNANQPYEKRGTFERANGGTLFLDEVGDMSLKTQAKVLRALDEQRFYPVGASTPVHIDARVIAATNKDLEEEIARGNFREDLFYRLNVIPFFVPPLRDRKEDIPLLAREFLLEFGQQYGRPRVEISEAALTQLKQYRWPGNVRELRNVIERVLILNPKVQRIEAKHLPMLVQRTDSGPARGASAEPTTLQQAREAYERDYILKELDRCGGNVTRAAESLGLERSHLYRKMKTLGINVGE